MANTIITTSEVKVLLQIDSATTTYDSLIAMFIPIIQDYIILKCKQEFLDEDDTTEYDFPEGLKYPASLMIGNILSKRYGYNLSGFSIGNRSESYIDGYPKEIIDLLQPYILIELI